MRISKLAMSTALMTSMICTAAAAQSAAPAGNVEKEAIERPRSVLEEIVVTAQKRQQPLQDVGISVSAFTGESLRDFGIKNSADLSQITPGLRNPQSGSGFTASFSLRGLSQSDFGASQEAPVALYIDEVYQSSQGASQFLLFDIQRTEVLRGPQGTLFGRNATGGLVHFITKKPENEASGYAEITYGRFNQFKPELVVNKPLGDTLSARLSLAGEWHDTIVDNRTGPDLWDANKKAGRLQLLFEPKDTDLSLLVSARAGAIREVGQPYIWDAARPTGAYGTGVLTPGLPDFFGFTNAGNGYFKVTLDPVSFHDVDNRGATATLTWNVGDTTISSITDFTKIKVSYAEDTDLQPGEFYHYFADQRSEQISQELRFNGSIGAVRWTAGGFYMAVDGDYSQEGRLKGLGLAGVSALTTVYDVETRSGSVFGQVEYDLSEQFRAIGGARYISEKKSQNYNSAFYDRPGGQKVGFGSSPDLLAVDGSFTDGLYSLKAELDYIPNDDVLVFLSYNRGVKAGGFNSPADPSGSAVFINPTTFDPAPGFEKAMRFKPEVLHSYELGLKSTIMDGNGRFNVSAFYYDYQDFQALSFSGVTTSYLINRDATLKGIDAELFLNPVDGLDLVFGASYLDQVVHDIPLGTASVDRKIPYAPTWNLTAMARYAWDAMGGIMSMQGNVNYVTDQEFALTNSRAARQNGYALANAGLGYVFPGEQLSVQLQVNNLFDKRYSVVAFDLAGSFGASQRQIGMPRTYSATLRYEF